MKFSWSLIITALTIQAQVPGIQGLLMVPNVDVAALRNWLSDDSIQVEQQNRLQNPVVNYKDVPELIEDIDDSDNETDDELWDNGDDVGGLPEVTPTLLNTQLAISRDISIFAGYIRNMPDMSTRFNDANRFSVILAPSDSAITKLSSKPWEFPGEVKGSEQDRDTITQNNLKDFVNKHVYFGELTRMLEFSVNGIAQLETEGGVKVEISDTPSGAKVRTQDNRVYNVLTQKNVYNGMIWVLDGSLSAPQ